MVYLAEMNRTIPAGDHALFVATVRAKNLPSLAIALRSMADEVDAGHDSVALEVVAGEIEASVRLFRAAMHARQPGSKVHFVVARDVE